MLSRISAALQSAVDTIAPPVPLLHDFVYHWRQLMKFYDNSSEALNVPIESTHLPIHLDQMLKALQEEQEDLDRKGGNDTGPCLEYLLQHRVPDLLASLACADTPSGMRHLGLVSFSRLITMTSHHLLAQAALYEPIQRMVKLCGQVSASPTEAQEVRLLCVLAAMVGQNPQLSELFCLPRNKQSSPEGSSSSSDTPSSPEIKRNKDSLLAEALLKYIDSADGRLRVKSCEALLILSTQPCMALSLAQDSTMAECLAMRLAALHRALPDTLEPADLEELPQPSWGQLTPTILLGAELACTQQTQDPDSVAHVRACSVTLALVAKLLRQCQAPVLRQALSSWLAGETETTPESAEEAGECVREAVLSLLEHAHGDLALETMRLLEVLVDEPYGSALNILVFSQLDGSKSMEAAALPELSNGKYPNSQTLAPTNIHLVLEGFLQLLPPFLRSAETEAGYESYLQRCLGLGCPLEVSTATGDDDCASSDSRPEVDRTDRLQNADSGLLSTLFARLELFPQQEYEVNLQLTALLSRLALLPHAALHEVLLSPTPPPTQGSFSLPSTSNQLSLGAALRKLANKLAQEAPSIPDLQKRLRWTRQKLLGDPASAKEEPEPTDYVEN
ncbi:hypothetical protein B566_EDAN015211 [Ephemera danica]|nr:hypothetical protein B566_EDAN015211 [Ephemera danica]